MNARRLELLLNDPATAPHGGGVLVIDDSGDRKDRAKTAHVGRQWLGRVRQDDNGVVTVTMVWADAVHPGRHFAKGKSDPGFRTKLAIGADLAVKAGKAGFMFRAVVADSAYEDRDGFRAELAEAGLPFVMAFNPRRGTWAYGRDVYTPVDAARALAWDGPDDPGDWHPVTRTFREGHIETWQAAGARLGWWGPDGTRRLVVATADPGTLPGKAIWYLVTSLPRPGGPREADSDHPAADLAEIVRLYGIRHWIEQSCKQVKDELGWGFTRSALMSRSAATRSWSTARSRFAGPPGLRGQVAGGGLPQCRHDSSPGRQRSHRPLGGAILVTRRVLPDDHIGQRIYATARSRQPSAQMRHQLRMRRDRVRRIAQAASSARIRCQRTRQDRPRGLTVTRGPSGLYP